MKIVSMKTIHSIIRDLLKDVDKPIIIEVGAHKGEDTVHLAEIPKSTVYAFECDPRNFLSHLPVNAQPIYKAVSNQNGLQDFWLSERPGAQWTCSSSLLEPKEHLREHPSIRFNKRVQVKTITLDTFCGENEIDRIDFLWMDVQGAEHLVFEGGKNILTKTKYIYTEYANNEQFHTQKSLDELLLILGDGWEVVNKWDYDVLLKNNNAL